MIQFKCNKCSEGLEAPTSMKGEAVRCPKCDFHNIIPDAPINTPPSEPVPVPTQTPPPAKAKQTDEIPEHRQLRIEPNGDIVLNKNQKSIKCPIQEGKRCDYRCAWLSLAKDNNLAKCQITTIGQVVSNNCKL